MVNLNNQYLYAKGTCNVVVRNITTGDVEYQSDKVQTNQFTTTADMGAIQGGIGNTTAINIPHNAAVNLTLTNADFSMAARAMQVGTGVAYNGIAPVCEAITATGATLTVTDAPAAPYGYTENICNVVEQGAQNAPGTAYVIDGATKQIQGFGATTGKTYIVTYFKQEASAQYFNISGMFSPAVKHVTVQIAIYSASGAQNVLQGSKVGDLYIIVPRMQFSGKADIDGSQTNAVTTDLSGTALTYGDANTGCADCAIAGLAQVLYVPAAGAASAVEGLAVIGGQITVAVGEQLQLPVKYVMPNGALVNPNYADLTYESGADATATVSATGLVEGVAVGTTDITVALADPALTCIVPVNVVSA